MGLIKWGIVAVVSLLVGLGIYVRTAPSDVAAWHSFPLVASDETTEAGVTRVIKGDAAQFAALDAIIRATPRTQVLAGSLEEGMITYITRSRVFGFPDYTTVKFADPQIGILGRLRFGRSDLGVNAARVDGWLEALGQG